MGKGGEGRGNEGKKGAGKEEGVSVLKCSIGEMPRRGKEGKSQLSM